jgi:hypothetical protein
MNGPSQDLPSGDCFVIAPIGNEGTETRKRTENLFDYIIKKAVAGKYTPFLAHRISSPGVITMQIIEKLIKSELVIADLTENNANVYYELALRHVLDLPVILVIQKGQEHDIPFDLQSLRVIPYDLSVDQAEGAIAEIAESIKGIQSDTLYMKNIISQRLSIFQEPEGPLENKILIGLLHCVNRYRFELIEPFFNNLVPIERRLKILYSSFYNVMFEAAHREYLKRETVMQVFDKDLKIQVSKLFDEVEPILGSLSAAMAKKDVKRIEKSLQNWRSNNSSFFKCWVEQYRRWVDEHLTNE